MRRQSERIEALRRGNVVGELLTESEKELLSFVRSLYPTHPTVLAITEKYIWLKQMLRLHPGYQVSDLFTKEDLES